MPPITTVLGVVTQRQLLHGGLARHDIARLIRGGRLRRVWRGVFVVGDPPEDVESRWRQGCAIAVAACGPQAALSGAAAAVFWGWDGFETGYPPTVDIPLAQRRAHPAARRRADVGDHVERGGVRLTSAAQTLVGLAECLTRRQVQSWSGRAGQWLSVADQVELAVETALRRGDVTERELLDLVAGCAPARRGQTVLEEVLQRRPPGQPATESYLETRCAQVLRNAGLPTGERQVPVFDARRRSSGASISAWPSGSWSRSTARRSTAPSASARIGAAGPASAGSATGSPCSTTTRSSSNRTSWPTRSGSCSSTTEAVRH